MLSIMTDYKLFRASNISLMIPVLLLQRHTSVYVFGVPQGSELATREITNQATRLRCTSEHLKCRHKTQD